MDHISDFFKNVRSRFANPLVFSFFLSWPICNYKITLALLWYDSETINKAGSNTIFEFIDEHGSWYNGLLYPLLIAVFYTIAIPFSKSCVIAIKTIATNLGDRWSIRFSDGHGIPFDKFLKYRDDYKNQTKKLKSAIEDIEKTDEEVRKKDLENTDLAKEVSALKTIKHDQEQRLQLLDVDKRELERRNDVTEDTLKQLQIKYDKIFDDVQGLNDMSILRGRWMFYCSDRQKNLEYEEEYEISEDIIYSVHGNSRKSKFRITNFFYNKSAKSIFFVKRTLDERSDFDKSEFIQANDMQYLQNAFNELKKRQGDTLINELSYDQLTHLKGIQNTTSIVTYRKIL